MDIFNLRQHIIDEYAKYTKSFLYINDPAIREYIDDHLNQGKLWPEALIQLSPAYETAESIGELVTSRVLHPTCAQIFQTSAKKSLTLYRHQRQAIDHAQQGHHFVVTTGTGSGKSLTYMVPIINHVLKHNPEQGKVRAIIVYPMNALINSQDTALERFFANLPEAERSVVSYARYTGQESDQRKREIQQNPPHILLTNYVMLELMLTRPDEFQFVDRDHAALQFIVLDELHTYRGRQGADVALLMRRVRERCGNPQLQCIGTSATMTSGGESSQRKYTVASVASRLFGVTINPEHIIEESLKYETNSFATPKPELLRQELSQPFPETLAWNKFTQMQLAIWLEQTYSIERSTSDATLQRAKPKTLQTGAAKLAEMTGLAAELCTQRLQEFFAFSQQIRGQNDQPGFAFKLHQFISQGGSVYATLAEPAQRQLSMDGQQYIKNDRGDEALLFPLMFCRECGQHYYLCSYSQTKHTVLPRNPLVRADDAASQGRAGYLIVGADMWNDEQQDLLPESWFTTTKRGGRTPKPAFREFIPQAFDIQPDGKISDQPHAQTTTVWFIPTPFLTCLSCGVVYTRGDKNDYPKLARLSGEGRSTATTLVSLAAINAMRQSDLDPQSQKLLSFTDNRQDASLQAGHLNDFVGVALLRSAIYQALDQQPTRSLNYLNLAHEVFLALALPTTAYYKDPNTELYPHLQRQLQEAFTELIEYRLYEDLRRSWRISQPNLEQCGLLEIRYSGLAEAAAESSMWSHRIVQTSEPEQRLFVIRALLDYMRRELAIDCSVLDPQRQKPLRDKSKNWLNDTWKIEENEVLRMATRFVLPNSEKLIEEERSLAARTTLGRFLRSPQAWPQLEAQLNEADYLELIAAIFHDLARLGIIYTNQSGKKVSYQLRCTAIEWHGTNYERVLVDPVRSRRMNLNESNQEFQRRVNLFFRDFYRLPTERLRSIEGREHTGQVKQEDRELREQAFRKGNLPALFCSPTMELGIDIADLNMVHLRNVPPTPANYAQRSGRAGRSGQAALVATYCATGSGHDQYFFQRPIQMVNGVVAPPQIELQNHDLLQAHIHAVWLSHVGIELGRTMLHLLDPEQAGIPLHQHIREQLQLSPSQTQICFTSCLTLLNDVQTIWLTPSERDSWLHHVLDQAPLAFDAACERWRNLFRTADLQLREARQIHDSSHVRLQDKKITDDAKRRAAEASRQKDILCNNLGSNQRSDSEFYPYRYFASEGFLPGYNFPRLPVRTFLPTITSQNQQQGEFLSRPRFLALSEFGPQNIIYHEGRKYRVVRTQFPAGNKTDAFSRAKMCVMCGYFHENTDTIHDHCQNCGTRFDSEKSPLLGSIFEMPPQITRRVERISCEEEERLRQGYNITTHYRFANDQQTVRKNEALGIEPTTHAPLLHLVYGPQATILRINHGWRGMLKQGFSLDLNDGSWSKRPNEDGTQNLDPETQATTRVDVRIAVRDTRNLLVIKLPSSIAGDQQASVSLQYALQRSIQESFQIEEQELNSELVGEPGAYSLILWEATEGGAGVLRRLVHEGEQLSRVATNALAMCHFDPQGNDLEASSGTCVRACYRCLLTYGNQMMHHLIDRRSIAEILVQLTSTKVKSIAEANSTHTPNLSPAVAKVYSFLETHNYRLPSSVMQQIGNQPVDLWYEHAETCVLCPEPGQDVSAIVDQLDLYGVLVIVIDPERDLATQINQHQFWQQ